MLELQDVTKRYGSTRAVDGLSFTARPGAVTGFLGPNGAGKSTALRVLLGLDRPDAGRALVAGRPYVDRRAPLHEIGSLLDAKAVAPRRGARPHLLALARSNGIAPSRVDAVLERCGLTDVADRPAGTFSLGMGSGSVSLSHCSATRRCSCSTSRSTGWIPRASSGSARCCAPWRRGPHHPAVLAPDERDGHDR
jgi:ABC-type Na+ transport system ATPase subunit NatA